MHEQMDYVCTIRYIKQRSTSELHSGYPMALAPHYKLQALHLVGINTVAHEK